MADCCLIKKVATVEVYENKNEVRAYGFMAGDRNTPVMEVRFKHLWGESNLSSCKLRWIIVDDVGSLLVGEVPIQSDNTALINLPNELFTGDRRMKVQLTVASCDGERILNLQQFTDLKVINSLAPNEVVEPVYQILINQLYDETQKYLSQLDTLYTSQYGSLENLYVGARASLEQYLINAENGGNAEFLQGYTPAMFQKVESTIADLKASSKYNLGDVVEVLGFYAKGDGSHHKRIAKDKDDGSGELGQNGIWWCVVHSGEVNVSWFGAKGDGVTDDTVAIQKTVNYSKITKFDEKTYKITSTIRIPRLKTLVGKSSGSLFPLKTILLCDFSESLCWAIESVNTFNGKNLPYNETVRGYELYQNYSDATGIKISGITLQNNSNIMIYGGVRLNYGFASHMEDINVHGNFGCGFLRNACWNFTDKNLYAFTNFYGYVATKEVQSGTLINIVARKNIDLKKELLDYPEFEVIELLDSQYADTGHLLTPNVSTKSKGFVFQTEVHNLNITACVEGFDIGVSSWFANGITFDTLYLERPEMISCFSLFKTKMTVHSSLYYCENATVLDLGFDTQLTLRADSTLFIKNVSYRESIVDLDKNVSNKSILRTDKNLLTGKNYNKDRIFIDGLVNENVFVKYNHTLTNERLIFVASESGGADITLPSLSDVSDGTEIKIIRMCNISQAPVRVLPNGSDRLFSLRLNSTINVLSCKKTDYSFYKANIFGDIMWVFDDKGVELNLLNSLDTPYYTLKMQQEGIYEDYVSYRDELHEYENSQTSGDTMMLTVLQEPEIPESVRVFAEKYKLI